MSNFRNSSSFVVSGMSTIEAVELSHVTVIFIVNRSSQRDVCCVLGTEVSESRERVPPPAFAAAEASPGIAIQALGQSSSFCNTAISTASASHPGGQLRLPRLIQKAVGTTLCLTWYPNEPSSFEATGNFAPHHITCALIPWFVRSIDWM